MASGECGVPSVQGQSGTSFETSSQTPESERKRNLALSGETRTRKQPDALNYIEEEDEVD